jgi:hypothetical protein
MVISLVPNARSFPYRIGKRYQEQNNLWEWGKEQPKSTLKKYFEQAGLKNIHEYTIDPGHSLEFLRPFKPGIVMNMIFLLYRLMSTGVLNMFSQGYLLVTVGRK